MLGSAFFVYTFLGEEEEEEEDYRQVPIGSSYPESHIISMHWAWLSEAAQWETEAQH